MRHGRLRNKPAAAGAPGLPDSGRKPVQPPCPAGGRVHGRTGPGRLAHAAAPPAAAPAALDTGGPLPAPGRMRPVFSACCTVWKHPCPAACSWAPALSRPCAAACSAGSISAWPRGCSRTRTPSRARWEENSTPWTSPERPWAPSWFPCSCYPSTASNPCSCLALLCAASLCGLALAGKKTPPAA